MPGTLVLMADGTTTAIEDIEIGDWIWAADPETGEAGPRRVTDTIVGDGTKQMVDILIDGATITATGGHPFWVDDQGRWVDADDLESGDLLVLADGPTVDVDAVATYTGVLTVHNLTVDGIHTYHVLAGDDPVLVHNCGARARALVDKLKELSGHEIRFGPNFRIAPFGNRTGHPTGRFPHYHRRGIDSMTGETSPGQGHGRHRTWDTKAPDTSFWDRF